jgi:hypothetical protein
VSGIILPVLKTFAFTRGVDFLYRYQYLQGVPTSARPINLTGASATLTLTSWDGLTTYKTLTSGATPGTSGIFFGGGTHNPLDGTIDIVIVAADTSTFTWKYARYNMSLITTLCGDQRLLYGSFGGQGFLP